MKPCNFYIEFVDDSVIFFESTLSVYELLYTALYNGRVHFIKIGKSTINIDSVRDICRA